jgi:O-antigen ligase
MRYRTTDFTNRQSHYQINSAQIIHEERFPALNMGRLFLFALVTGIVWLGALYGGTPGQWLVTAFTGLLLLKSLHLLSQQKVVDSLAVLFYLAIIQPALRTYAGPLPYLTLEYFFVLWALLAIRKQKISFTFPTVLYLLYMILEVFGITTSHNLELARSIVISSSMVGIVLLLSSQIHINKFGLHSLFTAALIGITNHLVIIGYTYVSSGEIVWTIASNFSSSGNMGPVQISMLLAIGVIVLLVLAERVGGKQQFIYPILATGVGGIMLLTFSRNGLYLSVIALAVYFLLFNHFRPRSFIIFIILAVSGFYVFNYTSQIAGPALITRYSDLDTTNRWELVVHGWNIFMDNFWLGVGTSNYYTVISQPQYFGSYSGAHNELIRAASEHGIWGIILWMGFAISATWRAFSQYKGKTRALRMTFVALFFAYLAVNGLKLFIQPLILLVALSAEDF